jgi:hypothetical protein
MEIKTELVRLHDEVSSLKDRLSFLHDSKMAYMTSVGNGDLPVTENILCGMSEIDTETENKLQSILSKIDDLLKDTRGK